MSPRDALLDARRGALALAVVLGHLLAARPTPESFALAGLLYGWHMPAWALLQGDADRRLGARGSARLAALGLLVAAALAPFGPADLGFGRLAPPPYHLWWVAALLLWRALPLSPAAALAVSLGGGALADFDGLARVLSFWPFYAWGRGRGLPAVPRPAAALLLALAAFMGAACFLTGRVPLALQDRGYGGALALGAALRLGWLAVSGLGGAGALSLLRRPSAPLARIGRSALGVYLLHPFATIPAGTALAALPEAAEPAAIAGAVLVAGAVAWALSAPAARRAVAGLTAPAGERR